MAAEGHGNSSLRQYEAVPFPSGPIKGVTGEWYYAIDSSPLNSEFGPVHMKRWRRLLTNTSWNFNILKTQRLISRRSRDYTDRDIFREIQMRFRWDSLKSGVCSLRSQWLYTPPPPHNNIEVERLKESTNRVSVLLKTLWTTADP